jgi:hypothetical protein
VSKSRVLTPAYYTLLFLFLAWIGLSLYGYADDDAYIHFRIVENFLKYGQPYFNPGEPVMASSSSGWTLTLYLIFLLFGVNLKAVALFNAAVSALDVYVYARIIGGLTGRSGLTDDLLASLAVVPVLVYSSAGLMETPLAMLVLGIGVLLYIRKLPVSFMFMAASVFFRLELGVFPVLFAAHSLYRKNVPPGRVLGYMAAGAAPFVFYDMYFFGTIIPHTVIAKRAVYSLGPQWVLHFALPPLLFTGDAGRVLELALMLSVTATALFWAVGYTRGRGGPIAVLALSGLSVLGAYFAARTMVFQWYLPVYALPLFVSLLAVAKARKAAVFGILVAAVLYPYVAGFAHAAHAAAYDVSRYEYFSGGARARKYLDVGARLRARYPGCTVMCSEIGALGYSYKGYIYDACGLASDGALKYHPMKVPEDRSNGVVGAIPPGYVEETRPDIIVCYDSFGRALVRSDVLKDYVSLREDIYEPDDMTISGGGGLWGSNALNVYVRRDKYTGAF